MELIYACHLDIPLIYSFMHVLEYRRFHCEDHPSRYVDACWTGIPTVEIRRWDRAFLCLKTAYLHWNGFLEWYITTVVQLGQSYHSINHRLDLRRYAHWYVGLDAIHISVLIAAKGGPKVIGYMLRMPCTPQLPLVSKPGVHMMHLK